MSFYTLSRVIPRTPPPTQTKSLPQTVLLFHYADEVENLSSHLFYFSLSLLSTFITTTATIHRSKVSLVNRGKHASSSAVFHVCLSPSFH